MAVTSTPKIVTDGLVLYFDPSNVKSYPTTGLNYYDLTQDLITGSLRNGVAFDSEKNGILKFDGTNDFIYINHNSRFNFPNAWTISYWIRIGKVMWQFGDLIISKRIDGQNINYQTYASSGSTINTPTGYSIGFGGNTAGSFWGVGLSGSSQQLAYNTWYHITGRYSSNRVDIFVNGTIVTGSASLPNLATSTAQLNISGYSNGGNPFSGSMGNVWLYNRALTDVEIFQNYEVTRERYNYDQTMTDLDAIAFVNVAGLRDDTQKRAINGLVVDLKNAGLWSKMKAIYPMVGGTAVSHKWNLKDPRDVDAAFRLVFYGGWTHSSTGAKGNGSTSYADTRFFGSASFTNNDTHISYYSRTNSDGNYIDMGTYRPTTPTSTYDLCIRLLGNYYYDAYSLSNRITGTSTTSLGYYCHIRTGPTTHKVFRNGIQFASSSDASVSNTSNLTLPIYLNASNDNGTPQYRTDRECGFSSIGDGLTDTDSANLYAIVQKYQTTLGRQV